MRRIIFTFLILFFALVVQAQHSDVVPAVVYQGDTIPHLYLEQANVWAKGRYVNRYHRQQRRNLRLEYNVRKVYPYARIAARKVSEIENRLQHLDRNADRRKILKEEYAHLMKTFKKPLMKLSFTQGRILVRLIYRETHNTSFSHIREYRGAVSAYFWQSVALIFGNNLKAAYDPQGADREIEQIVQKILQGK